MLVSCSIAALSVATAACGGGNGSGSPTAPSPTTANIVISGYTAAITGPAPQTFPLTATANSSAGTSQNVSSMATWASDAPTVASVTAGGVVTTTGNGSATITAGYGGMIGRVTITVGSQSKAVPTMTGNMAISVSPDTNYLYRAQLLLTFTETGGGGSYDVTGLEVVWSNAYWQSVETTTLDPAQIASAFGGSNTVPAGGSRQMVQVLDYTYTQSGMNAEVTAQFRDSSGNTSTARATYGGTLMTGLAASPLAGPDAIAGVRR
jgi:hypothetical protein